MLEPTVWRGRRKDLQHTNGKEHDEAKGAMGGWNRNIKEWEGRKEGRQAGREINETM